MDERIAPDEAHDQRHTAEAPLIIDVRSPAEYQAEHVAGAINIPLDELAGRLGELPDQAPVITYCMMKHRGHSRGERAADLLRSKGYNAAVLEGGLPAWQAAGLPTQCGL